MSSRMEPLAEMVGEACGEAAALMVANQQSFFFSSRRRHTSSVSAFLLNRSSDLMLCVTIFVILVVWFLLPRVARLMIHTPTAISIFVCLSMVQLMAVFISMRCTLCGHFLQVALTLILVVGYAIAAS